MSRHVDPEHRPPAANPDPSPSIAAAPRDFLQSVIHTAAEGICVCAKTSEFPYLRFTLWNDRMTELTGYALAEVNRDGWYQTLFRDPELRTRIVDQMEGAFTGKEVRQEEWTIVRKDGTARFVAVSMSRLSAGADPSIVALISDASDRKAAELALRTSEDRLAMSQRLARLGSWEWNIVNGEVWWSDELHRLYGQNPTNFRPSLDGFFAQLHPDEADLVRRHLQNALENEGPYAFDFRVVRPDGSIRWKRSEGVVERDVSGQPIRMWGTAQDITDQRHAAEAKRQLEDQLREAQRLESVGVLAGGIAHEFNNLLTTIIGHAELAEMAMPPHSPGQLHLPPIRLAAERAAELCRKLLAYAGKSHVVLSQLDLNNVVREAIERAGPTVPPSVDFASTPLRIRGDAEQLRQLVANLLANAVEAEGEIWIKTRLTTLSAEAAATMRHTPGLLAGEYVFLEVRDSGQGMDSDTLSRALEPFFSTKFAGRGLGLSVVLGVVRMHGGGLEVTSSPGHGTTARVYLPPV